VKKKRSGILPGREVGFKVWDVFLASRHDFQGLGDERPAVSHENRETFALTIGTFRKKG